MKLPPSQRNRSATETWKLTWEPNGRRLRTAFIYCAQQKELRNIPVQIIEPVNKYSEGRASEEKSANSAAVLNRCTTAGAAFLLRSLPVTLAPDPRCPLLLPALQLQLLVVEAKTDS
jgi:hypothetical protein